MNPKYVHIFRKKHNYKKRGDQFAKVMNLEI